MFWCHFSYLSASVINSFRADELGLQFGFALEVVVVVIVVVVVVVVVVVMCVRESPGTS